MNSRRQVLIGGVAAIAIASIATKPAFAMLPEQPPLPPVNPGQRETILFNDDWRFAFGHANDEVKDFGFGKNQRTYAKQGPDSGMASQQNFDDSGWRKLNVPHDWAVELPFANNPNYKPDPSKGEFEFENWDGASDHGYKPIGRNYPETSIGWYRNKFSLKDGDREKRINLEFDGVFRNSMLMINGYIVNHHQSGYTPFAVDITDFLNTDEKPNIVCLRVDATLGEGWFYEGAGIYRNVRIVKTAPVFIPQFGVCIRTKNDGSVTVLTKVANKSNEEVEFELINREGISTNGASSNHKVGAGEIIEIKQEFKRDRVALWSIENPYLYLLYTIIKANNGDIIDGVSTSFGFREVRFDAENGFFLNGKPVKLKGTCNHQDHAGVGSAIPDALNIWRIKKLKEMGCNAYRASHNPPTEAVLDACDRLGMLVIDETRMMTSSKEGLEQLETLIHRDRNHPSVILWSIGNEEPQQGTQRGANVARTMKRLCNRLDPTRLVTAALDSGFGAGITSVIDVIGFNYRDGKIDDFHKQYPHIPIIGSETGSTVSTRGEYVRDPSKHIVPAYDTDAPWWASTAEAYWPHFAEKSYIAGAFIWTGFDYRGEPTPYNKWPSISSQFGVLDTCGFEKDNFYYYKSWWQNSHVLHLFPHWNWAGKEGQNIPVWVHSNLDEVELFHNGRSMGKKRVTPNRHLEWSVPYAPGKIEAVGRKNGQVVMRTKRETAGAPYKIMLSQERTTAFDFRQNDVVIVNAAILDAKGNLCPMAGNLVEFSIAGGGKIIGVGNGNPNSHEADKATKRKAFNGLCCAIIEVPRGNSASIIATSIGLISATLGA